MISLISDYDDSIHSPQVEAVDSEEEEHFGAQVEIYQSKKITNKLVQQIQGGYSVPS